MTEPYICGVETSCGLPSPDGQEHTHRWTLERAVVDAARALGSKPEQAVTARPALAALRAALDRLAATEGSDKP